MRDTYVDGKKLARNGRKTATYYAASFLPHYKRVLFSHLLVFNLGWKLTFFSKSYIFSSFENIYGTSYIINIPNGSPCCNGQHHSILCVVRWVLCIIFDLYGYGGC